LTFQRPAYAGRFSFPDYARSGHFPGPDAGNLPDRIKTRAS